VTTKSMSYFSNPKINASINMNYHGTNNRMNLPNNSITHIHINYGSQQTKYTIHELNQKVFYKIYKIIRVVINPASRARCPGAPRLASSLPRRAAMRRAAPDAATTSRMPGSRSLTRRRVPRAHPKPKPNTITARPF
jgi:hypothetical protein